MKNYLILCLALAACGGGSGGPAQAPAAPSATQNAPEGPVVGFFTPRGVPPELVDKTSIGMINAQSPAQVAASLQLAEGHGFKVNIDLGPVLARPASFVGMTYRDLGGTTYTKVFAPLPAVKLRQFPTDDQIRSFVGPYLDVMAGHSTIGTVFLADEPYLNGISKAEMERAGRVVRQEMSARAINAKLGVIFASGMFNAEFATHIDEEAGEFVKRIDSFYQSGLATPEYVTAIQTSRLTTYDTAGNMYEGGGIPDGFEVVGFDFYLSTLLLDSVHEPTLSWLAARYPSDCGGFAGTTMTQLRLQLSFFRDGPVQNDAAADRNLLDKMYLCRMQATTKMLQEAIAGRGIQILLISESSNNGVLEFDASQNIEPSQPALLVEARVLDEVKRAEALYSPIYSGLVFFTYDNEFDATINLKIGGASGMPSVLESIFAFSAKR